MRTRGPEKVISAALAAGVHVLFIAFLVFGLSWKTKQPETFEVDLWNTLPIPKELPAVKPMEPKPVVQQKPQPEPPPPEKPFVESKPEAVKPEILLKEKLEKERKKEELVKQDTVKREREKQRLVEIKEARAKEETEALRRNEAEARERQEEQAAAAHAQIINEYIARIQSKIRHFVVMPPNISGNPQAEFDVVLLPGGDVLSVKRKRTSGYPAYDQAVERAIYKAQPLPLPSDQSLFNEFRQLTLKFHPEN